MASDFSTSQKSSKTTLSTWSKMATGRKVQVMDLNLDFLPALKVLCLENFWLFCIKAFRETLLGLRYFSDSFVAKLRMFFGLC